MKNYLILLVTFLVFNNLFAQNATVDYSKSMYYMSEFEIKEPLPNNIIGSPYRYNEFSLTEVFFTGNDSSLFFNMNYNAYTDAIEFKQDKRTYQVSNPQKIKKIIFQNEVLVYRTLKEKNYSSNGFVIELVGHQIGLYKQENIKLIPAKTAINTYDSSEPAKYAPVKPKFYYSIDGNTAILIRNKKQLIGEFRQKVDLKNYFTTEKINLSSEQDLIKLFNYLNEF
jgi:hypothetical protein